MSRRCQVLGTIPSFGNSASQSHRRTRRHWDPNIQSRRYCAPSLGRHVTLTVSARGIHAIDQIVVLDEQGRVAQTRVHEELRFQPGICRDFCSHREQAKGW